MFENDYDEFAAIVDTTAGMYTRGAVLQGQKDTFFRQLAAFPLTAVRYGFEAHTKDPEHCKFLPMPGDIIRHINTALDAEDGRPGAEVAWDTAVRAADESVTLVWTDETAQAWGLAHNVHKSGDKVGARMAFREAYTRIVADARKARMPVRWVESLGHVASQRDEVIQQAQAAGLLPAPVPVALLSGPAVEPLTPAQLRSNRQRVTELLLKLRAEQAPNGGRQTIARIQALLEAGKASTGQKGWLAEATKQHTQTVQPCAGTAIPMSEWPWVKREREAAMLRATDEQGAEA